LFGCDIEKKTLDGGVGWGVHDRMDQFAHPSRDACVWGLLVYPTDPIGPSIDSIQVERIDGDTGTANDTGAFTDCFCSSCTAGCKAPISDPPITDAIGTED
jgi:hypothetical protein